MGGRIVRLLRDRGHRVRVLDLDRPGARRRVEATGAEFHPADVSDPASLAGAFAGADSVLHLAAVLLSRGDRGLLESVNARGTAHVAEAALQAGSRRFVHVSSISVAYRRQNPYSLSKRGSERVARESGMDWTILRPTLAWGDPLAAEHAAFRRAVLALPVLPLPGGGRARKRPVHVDDLAEAFASCLERPASIGRILSLSGPATITLSEMASRIRASAGRAGVTVPLPAAPCGLAASALEGFCRAVGVAPPFDWQTFTGLVEDADPDNAEAVRLLGWNPRPWSPEP